VTLVALPATHVASLHVSTTFDDAGVDATLGVEVELAGEGAGEGAAVLLDLLDPAGEKVLKERAACDGCGRAELRLAVAAPAKWDAEHPNLYRLEVTLEREGEVVEVVRERVGFREISFGGARDGEPNRVYVNGRDAARVELIGAHPQLVVDNQWWYPQLAWGNDCGRPVQFVEGTTRGEVCLQVGPAARD